LGYKAWKALKLKMEADENVARYYAAKREEERRAKKRKLAAITALLFMEPERKERDANKQRDRREVERKMRDLSDSDFQRMYGVERERFASILNKISPHLSKTQLQRHMAEISSGSEVCATIQLAIALRMARGGSYLDIAFAYCVEKTYVYACFYRVFEAIDKEYDNIQFSFKEADLNRQAATFDKYGELIRNVVAAGDGCVFRMRKPSKADTNDFVTGYYSRKGHYAWPIQAFCDGNKKFVYVESSICSSAHDSTAYAATVLSKAIRDGKLPPQYCVLLDAAYTCTAQELTPWKGRNLTPYQDAWNFLHAAKRQCIEGAFGLLVRCWGILWRALEMNFKHISLVLRVLCKLHNMRVDDFLVRRAEATMEERDVPYYSENVEWRHGDLMKGADIRDVPQWTDMTRATGRGARTDKEACPTRDEITLALERAGIVRPKGESKYKKVCRR